MTEEKIQERENYIKTVEWAGKELLTQIEDLKTQSTDWQQKKQDLEKQLDEEKDKVSQSEKTINSLEQKIQESNGKIKELKQKEGELTKQLQTTREELKNKETINQGLTQQIEELKSSKKEIEKELKHSKEENSTSQVRIKELESQINKLKEEEKKAKDKIKSLDSKVLNIKNELDLSKKKLDEAKTELEKSEQELEKEKEKSEELEIQLEKIKTKNANLEKEKTDLEQVNKAVYDALDRVYNRWSGATIIDREKEGEVLGKRWVERLWEQKTISKVNEKRDKLIEKINEEEKKEQANQKKYEGEIQIEIDKANSFIKNLNLSVESSSNLLEKLRTFRDEWGFGSNRTKRHAFLNKNKENLISKLIRELQIKIRIEEAIESITRALNREPRLDSFDLGDKFKNFISTLRQMNDLKKINEYENEALVLSSTSQQVRSIRANLIKLIKSANQILNSSDNSPEAESNRKRVQDILKELEKFSNSTLQADELTWRAYISRRAEVNKLTNLVSGTLYQVIRKQALDRLAKRKELLVNRNIVVSESEFSNYQRQINQANLQELQDQKYENEFLGKMLETQRLQPRIQQNN
jgi:hypothetical protein